MANASSDIAAATRANMAFMISSLAPSAVTLAVRSALCSGGSPPRARARPVLVLHRTTFLDRVPQDHHKAAETRAFAARLARFGLHGSGGRRHLNIVGTQPVRIRSTERTRGEKMFAVIKTGGKQYRVAADDVITIDKVKGEPGDLIEFGEVLLLGGDSVQLGNPTVGGASVAGEVVDQGRGEKVIAFKKRRRKNSRRKRGHRQEFTVVRITEILTEGRKPSPRPQAEARPKPQRAPEPEAESEEAEQPAATPRKRAAAKKTAAKKPAARPKAQKRTTRTTAKTAKKPAGKGRKK